MREAPGRSALVVDDDPQVAALVSRWLTAAGYLVTTTDDFEEAKRRVVGRTDLSVLVVDVRLGGFNGIYLAILARQQVPTVRIVVLSGWDDPVLRKEADACGAVYLCKPITANDLLASI
jgi:two-component system response regulator YesN